MLRDFLKRRYLQEELREADEARVEDAIQPLTLVDILVPRHVKLLPTMRGAPQIKKTKRRTFEVSCCECWMYTTKIEYAPSGIPSRGTCAQSLARTQSRTRP